MAEGGKIHLVVEAHLQIDETILNPSRIGPAVAKKVTALLEEMYGPKKGAVDENTTRVKTSRTVEKTRQVHTLIVSHRTAEMAERLDTQE